MRHFHYFDTATGVIHPDAIAINSSVGVEEAAAANCPPGHKVIEGHFDRLSQRVDVATGEVVDYQPPPPSPDHEWEPVSKRWRLSAAATEREGRQAAVRAQIIALEQAQARPVREVALGIGGADARQRLAAIEGQIAELRKQL